MYEVGAGPVDLVGVGFGPSNLALGIAVEEHNETAVDRPLTTAFVERQGAFGWHRGMLIDDATMQVSFLKDLVTMRNPTSRYSFVAYLQDRGRLADFVNHKTLFPLRIEFHDYLEWAAARLAADVAYGSEVVDVAPVVEEGAVTAFDVVSRRLADGALRVRRAHNVAVALGLVPSLPEEAELGPRVWHNLDLLRRVGTLPEDRGPRRFVVIGAGQSAAEVVAYLHTSFPAAEVCSVFSRFGYTPSDDTPFANRIFDPDAVDLYYGADEAVRRRLFDYHRNTNYSVVDEELIVDLYKREYREKVQGSRRLRMVRSARVVDVRAGDDDVAVDVEDLPTGEVTTLTADALVYATGYRPADPATVLGQTAALVRRRGDGQPEVTRDYRLVLNGPAEAAVYLQGGTEHTHGISSTLLSNLAVRTGEIAGSLADRRAHRAEPGTGVPEVVAQVR
jgi:L-ornithine N5-monooxygenase